MNRTTADCDVVVIGGGPGGAVAARELARSGHTVTLVEKTPGPRFHIGESLLPRTTAELAEIGLLDRMTALPHIVKRGATFVAAAGTLPGRHLAFAEALDGDDTATFNIERELFDAELLDAAREAGVDVHTGTTVTAINTLTADDIQLQTSAGSLRARALIDASGQAAIVGRHRGTRQTLPGHERVAYFSHLTGVKLPDGDPSGYGIIVMFDEGWFWLIPIDASRTSVGVVLPAELTRRLPIPAHDILRWAVEKCPEMQHRCADATIPDRNHVIANFSYTCRPFAGSAWMMVGDAAGFMDPIFSGGVTLALLNARWAAAATASGLRTPARRPHLARDYDRRVHRAMHTLFMMIENYYQPAYRDLLHHGTGPFSVHRAAIEQLAGRAFPAPRLSVAWRMGLMKVFRTIQRRHAIVPRMPRWSIAEAAGAADVPEAAPTRESSTQHAAELTV